jgi:DNA-directed RNA polymerase specialized sigma24 family protein
MRYESAKEAADTYCEIRQGLDGVRAIDYAKPIVQTSARPEAPATAFIDVLQLLKRCFDQALVKVDEKRAVAWLRIRIDGESEREVARDMRCGKTTVRRWVSSVDDRVEQQLADLGLMLRGIPRLHAARIEDYQGEGEGDAVTGPRQKARVLHVPEV